MLTVTVSGDAGDDLFDRLADLRAEHADDLEVVRWQMWEPLPPAVAERVSAVFMGHYWRPRNWKLLRQLPKLRTVFLPSAGFDHALPFIPPGVTLCNGRGVHSAGTAELAVALTLAAQRGLADAFEAQREERWFTPILPALVGRRVLVVGAGSLAQAIVARLEPFEVEITVVGQTARTENGCQIHAVTELLDLLSNADVVILAVPNNASTQHLIDATALAAMPDGALLVNVARGVVVDTDALVAELQSGRLRAALDVTDPEPLPPGHPLWHAPNTIITAHQGGNSTDMYPRTAALVERQIRHLLKGEPLENVIEH